MVSRNTIPIALLAIAERTFTLITIFIICTICLSIYRIKVANKIIKQLFKKHATGSTMWKETLTRCNGNSSKRLCTLKKTYLPWRKLIYLERKLIYWEFDLDVLRSKTYFRSNSTFFYKPVEFDLIDVYIFL